jgi:hypothetical protein
VIQPAEHFVFLDPFHSERRTPVSIVFARLSIHKQNFANLDTFIPEPTTDFHMLIADSRS